MLMHELLNGRVEKGDRHLTFIVFRWVFTCRFGASPLFQQVARTSSKDGIQWQHLLPRKKAPSLRKSSRPRLAESGWSIVSSAEAAAARVPAATTWSTRPALSSP